VTTGRHEKDDSFRDCGKEIVVVRKKGVTVRVFTVARKGCSSYLIAYYLGKKRHRETFRGTVENAKARAAEIAETISSQSAGDGILPLADVRAYEAAVEALKPLGLTLPAAVAELLSAKKRIGNRSLADAAEFYATHAQLDAPQKSLAEVAQEFLDAKRADKASLRYRQWLRYAIEPACVVLTRPIAEITEADVDDYLRSLTVSTRSRHNVRGALVSLFGFAQSRGYIPRDRASAAKLSARVKVQTGEVEIFTPGEMAALLAAADGDTLPLIALGGFAGLRTAEVARLEWRDVNLTRMMITVSKAKSKTRSRRNIPIQSNLAAWLAPYAKATGPVLRFKNTTKLEQKAATTSNVVWKHNALRHSFASYRLAQVESEGKVALEMGNSPQMIIKHYRELVSPADAAAWWAIIPK